MILLWSLVLIPILSLVVPAFVQKTSGSQLSLKEILQTFCLPLFLSLSQVYCHDRAEVLKSNELFDLRNEDCPGLV